MNKLNIKYSVFLRGVWSFTWRWAFILACMFVCIYWINQLIGFTWWLQMKQSGAVKIIFETVVAAFMCAALQIFVGVWIYQFGQKKLIKPLLGPQRQKSLQEEETQPPKDVFGEPLTDVFGDPVDFKCKVIPFAWRRVETLCNLSPADDTKQLVLFFRKNKYDSACLVDWVNSDALKMILEYHRTHGGIFVGWCYADELADYLRTHSVVPQV